MRSTGVREQTISFSRENWQMEKMYVQLSARFPWNPLCCLSLRCCFIRVLVICWWQISTQGWSLCLFQCSLFFFASSQPLLNSPKRSPCQVGRYSKNLLPTYVWTADYNSQIFVCCKILSSPGRGVGHGAACFLSPAVAVCVCPMDLGAANSSSLPSQTGYAVPSNKANLNWK